MNINEITKELKEKYPEMEMTVAEDLVKSNKRKTYASELTKEDLQKMGIVDVDFDNLIVYGKNGPLKYHKNKKGYLMVSLYDVDENGNRIKIPTVYKYKKINGYTCESNSYIYKPRIIGLHRILWAWKYGKVHTGKVIDHINNKHTNIEDYKLENLQEITPLENLSKERTNYGTRRIRVVKDNMLEHYLNRLKHCIEEYEIAKTEHDARKCHNLRSSISVYQAKLRYICEKIEKKENF